MNRLLPDDGLLCSVPSGKEAPDAEASFQVGALAMAVVSKGDAGVVALADHRLVLWRVVP